MRQFFPKVDCILITDKKKWFLSFSDGTIKATRWHNIHEKRLERCCCWHQSRRRYSGLTSVLNCRFAHAALTEAGARVSRSLMKSGSPTYYEPEPYLIVAPQTLQRKERSHKICRVCSHFSPLSSFFFISFDQINYSKRNEEEKRR